MLSLNINLHVCIDEQVWMNEMDVYIEKVYA